MSQADNPIDGVSSRLDLFENSGINHQLTSDRYSSVRVRSIMLIRSRNCGLGARLIKWWKGTSILHVRWFGQDCDNLAALISCSSG